MRESPKVKLTLVFFILILLGVIAGALTTKPSLIKPLPKEADVKVIFTTPPPKPTAKPSPTEAEEEPTPTKKPTPKPTKKEPIQTLTPTLKPTENSTPSATPT